MELPSTVISPVEIKDLITITRMTFENMSGVDRQFTRITRNPISRLAHFMKMPVYLAFAGKGFKAVRDEKTVGCAFIHFRQTSAYVFNVSVNRPYRRQGVARQLMDQLETIAWQVDCLWMALQVDNGNLPAQELYHQLGYRAYHPEYLHKYGPIGGINNFESELAFEPLVQYAGELRFRRYHRTEIMIGDPWAAAVMADYDTMPRSRKRFYSCLLHGREIGVAMVSSQYQRVQIGLACQPDFWGHETTATLIQGLSEAHGQSPHETDIFLGSSAHHRAATPILTPLGFQTRKRWRMLMFKEIKDKASR